MTLGELLALLEERGTVVELSGVSLDGNVVTGFGAKLAPKAVATSPARDTSPKKNSKLDHYRRLLPEMRGLSDEAIAERVNQMGLP